MSRSPEAKTQERAEIWKGVLRRRRGDLLGPIVHDDDKRTRVSEVCGAWQELLDSTRALLRKTADGAADQAPELFEAIDRIQRAIGALEQIAYRDEQAR